jgi:hypothetical protein
MRGWALIFLRVAAAMAAALSARAAIYYLFPTLNTWPGVAALIGLLVGLGVLAAMLASDKARKTPPE